MDWSSLSCLFLVPVDAAAVPNMSLLLPQTASRFPSIDYRGFNHWTCLCSPLIECYFYKKDWVGKTGIGFNRDCLGFLGTWGTGLTFNRNTNQRQVLPRPGSEREDSLSGIPSDMIPSEAKVEWSKSPSGSVEEIEAKSSIQPFAWSPLRLTSFPNEPNLDTTFIKEIRPSL